MVIVVYPARADPVSLRDVDWWATLAADTSLNVSPPGSPASRPNGPWVATAATDGGGSDGMGHVSGNAVLDQIQYADLDGDGQEEALIQLDSGGTAGDIGLLLYHQGDPQPQLLAALGGYKLGAWLEDGRLLVFQPLWRRPNPGANCCPDTIQESTYSVQAGHLVLTRQTQRPVLDPLATVVAYYAALNRGDYDGAYSLLGRASREGQPYAAWITDVVAQLGSVHVETAEQIGPEAVSVRIRQMNLAEPVPQPRTFAGTWTLSRDPNAQRWLLDDSNLTETP